MSKKRLYSTEELLPRIRENRKQQVLRAQRGELGPDEEYDWAVGLMCSEELLQQGLLGEMINTIDDCVVEPDGECPHGYKSPLLLLGMI
jgi:hypothetical protein